MRIAFSTLAFPDASLAAAVSLGRQWGYAGVELRLIDGELIDPAMPAAARDRVKRTLVAAGLPAGAFATGLPAAQRGRHGGEHGNAHRGESADRRGDHHA